MNKIFKKERVIVLDETYTLHPDGFNGIKLQFQEPRTRKKKDSEEIEGYMFKEYWYYPQINQSLRKYLELSQRKSTSIEELVATTDKIYKIIENFDRTFNQY